MSVRTYVLMAALLATLIVGFSYLRVLARRILVDPWPHGEQTARTRLNQAALEPASGRLETVTLFFLSDDRKRLRAESRPLPLAAGEADRARQLLLALAEGSHSGHARALSPSAEVRAVFLAGDGTVFVDFSNEALAGLNPGIASETLAVYSIVNTLAANIPAIKKVRLLIQGQEVETLDGHADLSDDFVPDVVPSGPGA